MCTGKTAQAAGYQCNWDAQAQPDKLEGEASSSYWQQNRGFRDVGPRKQFTGKVNARSKEAHGWH